MHGSRTALAAFAILSTFVARWHAYMCMYVLQLYTRLQVELDHGQGGPRSEAGCPPFESSGVEVHVQPTATVVLYRFTL